MPIEMAVRERERSGSDSAELREFYTIKANVPQANAWAKIAAVLRAAQALRSSSLHAAKVYSNAPSAPPAPWLRSQAPSNPSEAIAPIVAIAKATDSVRVAARAS